MKWTSVKRLLPVMDLPCCGNVCSEEVLFTDGVGIYRGFVETVRGTGAIVWSEYNDEIIEDVTHWMPLPELPKNDSHP